ncbi:MAG: DUF1559 domain-containing protein, partial [Candidatus Omnitrophica bacterium]|nr:DUF1559 domain-containing protein [Candidatus Omnitrophota bacterium]
ALSRAREKARAAVCMNNLKQCGFAFHMYANDYDEFLPPAYYREGNYDYWFHLIAIYLGKSIDHNSSTPYKFEFGLMKPSRPQGIPFMPCPSARIEIKTRNNDTYTYSVNYYYGSRDDTVIGVFGPYQTGSPYYKGSKKLSQIKNQNCFLVVDGTYNSGYKILGAPWNTDTDADGVNDTYYYLLSDLPRSQYNYTSPRHSNGYTALMADGSVKYINFLEFLTNQEYWRAIK